MRMLGRTAATALVLSAVLAGGAAFAEPVTITFLHTNDVYEISPKDGKGGLGPLKTLLDRERAANPNTITTFGGDLISPSLMSGVTKGAQMIDLYNDLGTDVAVAGNHEFDFGPEVAAQRMGESKFPWLAANVLGKDGNVLAPMQGTAADLIKLSMVKVQQVLDTQGRGTKMIMQVHDELVFEVPQAEGDWLRSEIPALMASVATLRVPLLAEIGVGANWDQAH